MRKLVFIVNPKAGTGRARELLPQIEELCRKAGGVTLLTERPGHARELVRALDGDGSVYHVFACGGDGTLNEAAGGAAGRGDVALTHVPCGTGNDFVRMFGADAARFAAFECAETYDEMLCDGIDTNIRFALNTCAMGFDARAAMHMTRYRKASFLSKKLPYNLGVLTALLGGIARPLRVTVDGDETFEDDFSLVTVMNGRCYGGGFRPAPEAVPHDGLLDLVMVRKVSVAGLLRLIGHYEKGEHAAFGDLLIYRRCLSADITTPKPIPATFDGENEVTARLTAKVVPSCVRFLVPKGAAIE
ncbi:MAG: YegS/Rv2252/BmrU family lipid kinase [Oscillospiraceae bacterium]|jgi:YegS/Rv2252/BmrU family lipid kinase|nr:YegS/Rv2252/BmrU family lipid kinase [Oscillospiraceae bacterium]